VRVDKEPAPTDRMRIIYWTGFEKFVDVPEGSCELDLLDNLMAPHRTGFTFAGWEFVDFENINDDNISIYRARWNSTFPPVDYTDEDIVGTWVFNHDGNEVSFTFTAEGDFIYRSIATVTDFDGNEEEIEYVLYGLFRIEGDDIVILTVDTEFAWSIMPELVQFSFELVDDTLEASIFIVSVTEEEEEVEIDEDEFETIRDFKISLTTVEVYSIMKMQSGGV
jgi:hypothetical protein